MIQKRTKNTTKNNKQRNNRNRDWSRFSSDGGAAKKLKGTFVRTTMEAFCKAHPWLTYEILRVIFPGKLFKSQHTLFTRIDTAKKTQKIFDPKKKYFVKREEVIHLKDATIAVTNQFTIDNIKPVLKRLEELGYSVKKYSRTK